MRTMDPESVSDRDTAIVAAIGRSVPLRTVCALYDLDAATIRRIVESAGQTMPVESAGPKTLIAPRETEMLRRALNGEDFSVISRSHAVSREWVRQVVKKHTGLTARDLHSARDAARRQFKNQRARDLASSNPDSTVDELAEQAGLSVRDVAELLGPAESARRRRERTVTTATSKSEVLTSMRRVAAMQGGNPLSGPFYDAHRDEALSSARIVQLFGSWSAACDQAGVEAPRAPRNDYSQGWTRKECLVWVRQYLDTTANPTFDGYTVWARGREGAPSSGTVRLRCGKWIPTMRDAYTLAAGEALPPLGESRADGEAPGERLDEVAADVASSGPDEPALDDEGGEAATSSGQGPLWDAEVRVKIEMAAQERLMQHYRDLGWEVTDTHIGAPYDAVAVKDDLEHFLEAKGTQSKGSSVLVTRGEVEHARANPFRCYMGIWSGIVLTDDGEVRRDYGAFRVVPFDPDAGHLVVVGYEWDVPD